jgi:hypothetical protein
MLSKIPALLLSIVLVAMPATSAVMAQASDHAASWAAMLRQAESRGHRRIELRLLDGRRVKGNLVVLHPDTCVIQDGRDSVEVPYGQIETAKWKNYALSRPAKYLIVIAVGAAGLLLLAVAAR